MTIEQYGSTAPTHLTVDETVDEITSALQRARDGKISTHGALTAVDDLWSALRDHLSTGGQFPAAWVSEAPNPTESIDPTANDDGLFAFDFDVTDTPEPAVIVTSGPRLTAANVGPSENFPGIDLDLPTGNLPPTDVELTRGTQTKRTTHVLTFSEPSRLGRRGQHDIDATETSIEALNSADTHIHFELFRAFWHAGQNGFIDDELELKLNRDHQGLSAARREMVLQGYVQDLRDSDDNPVRRKTRFGRSARVRILTDVARRRVLLGKEPWFIP